MTGPLVYLATEIAASNAPCAPLDGTLHGAQRYVDSITRSFWWSSHSKPLINNKPVTKVLLTTSDDEELGAQVLATFQSHRGRDVPVIEIGPTPPYTDLRPVEDRWVILHELAHLWAFNAYHHHGRDFIHANAKLVRKFLGIEHHAAFVEALKDAKVRVDYNEL